MISRKSSFAIGAVTAVVIAGTGTAVAATGGTFILGKKNAATATTTLTNSKGTPLSLQAKKGAAPLKVNRTTKVKNLNADLLDGKDSTAFALKAGATGYVSAQGEWVDVEGDGINDFLAAIAMCPAGTKVTGGGLENYTPFPAAASIPVGSNAWLVAVFADPATDTGDELFGYAVCYNPTGKVQGAQPTLSSAMKHSQTTHRAIPTQQLQRLARALANR